MSSAFIVLNLFFCCICEMETPICVSQYFVNKQNVRSFRNILKGDVLSKNEDNFFLQHVLGDKSLVNEVPIEFLNILCTMKENLRHHSKDDFKKYFAALPFNGGNKNIISMKKDDIFLCSWTAIYEIIPRTFFGSNNNSKIFKKLVHIVLYSMKRQHILFKTLLEKWNLSAYPWKFLPRNISNKVLYNILIWIFRYILAAIISLNFYVTTCKLDADENKLHFFRKYEWQSFYDKKISDMIYTKVITRYDPYCLGKKAKMKLNLQDRLTLKRIKKEIPKLHLILKANSNCRPIVRYKNDTQSSLEKYKMKDKLDFLKIITGKPPAKLELQFSTLYADWLKLKKPKLYFVKTDLSNAFGSINRRKLMKIFNERYLDFQKKENSLYLKKKFAKLHKDIAAELQNPLLVRAGSTVYEWTEGLVQGYRYSPALSEMYYTHMDGIYFSEHFKNSKSDIQLFLRVVDDYLYITNSLDDARSFLNALSSYRNVNYDKTVVNFSHPDIKTSDEINFLGYSYNTLTLEVSRANNVYSGLMCYKIAFSSAIMNLYVFIANRIGQSGIQISGHIFNLYYNSEELVWRHIFTTFCLSANKFCTTLAILSNEDEMHKYLSIYKRISTVKLGNAIIQTLMKHKPSDLMFVYCINHLRYLSLKALNLFAKNTPKCNLLVPLINNELAKCNCIFGKWKNHASRIDTNGESQRLAVREVCTRNDLRRLFRTFDNVPAGFQCYNYKSLC